MAASLILATLLATGPYDVLCSLTAKASAAAIVAREAGVPLDEVLNALEDKTVDPIAQRLMRKSLLSVYSDGRNGAPFGKSEQTEFISQSTAMCITQLEREAAVEPHEPPSIPAGVPLPEPCSRSLRTECAAIRIRKTGVE